jgi:hypothetical protein
MKTFKNKNFVKRHYECINVVFCKSEDAPNDNYVEVDEIELDVSGCQDLWKETYTKDGVYKHVTYYGYM